MLRKFDVGLPVLLCVVLEAVLPRLRGVRSGEELAVGQRLRLVRVEGGQRLQRRLLGLGLSIGREVELVQRRGGGVVLASGGNRVALGEGVALGVAEGVALGMAEGVALGVALGEDTSESVA